MRTLLPLVVILILALVLVGCQKAAEETIEASTGVEVDLEEGSVKVTGEDGESAVISTGDTKLPEDFPEDFPIHDEDDLTSSSMVAAGNGQAFYITMNTNDSFAAVYDWYLVELDAAGWTIKAQSSSEIDGEMSGLLAVAKGDLEATISFQEASEATVDIALSVRVP